MLSKQLYVSSDFNPSTEFEIPFKQTLASGTYFVTCALAEAISESDMVYLDRKADILTFRVNQIPALSHGIAYLPTSISVRER